MFKKFQTGYQIAKTIASPITQAKNVISSAFKKSPTRKEQVTKYKKKALKMIKDATSKVTKRSKDAESTIGKKTAQEIGNTTKSKMMKDYLRYNKNLKAKGGRIGLKGGGDLGMQSVKYGLDNNPKVTAADPKAKFIAGNKKGKPGKAPPETPRAEHRKFAGKKP